MGGEAKSKMFTRVLALAFLGAMLVVLFALATQGNALAFADVADAPSTYAAAE